MKKIFSTMLVLLFCAFTFIQAQAADENVVDQAISDQTKAIILTKDHPHFAIRLKSNPSTGYTWILKFVNETYISVDFQKYLPPDSKLVGAEGITEFGFTAKSDAFKVARQFTITFMYMRPWEADQGSLASFTVVTQPATSK